MSEISQTLTSGWEAYELVDSGQGRKLERFGEMTLIRPEPKALWRPRREAQAWEQADAEFMESGQWKLHGEDKRQWNVRLGRLLLELRLTDRSKHVGLFPEQEPHWSWMQEKLKESVGSPKVLNLFGYTGVATLSAAVMGAKVTHLDASKPSVAWGKDNQSRSGLDKAPIRWLLDDALKFVAREKRRTSQYEGLLLDPPSFGRGPRGEVWKAEERLPKLLSACGDLLSPDARFMILTVYNLEASPYMLRNLMEEALEGRSGTITVGELALKHAGDSRLLPLSIYARWEA